MINRKRESLVKSIVVYSSSNIYRQALGVLNAYIKPRLLSPELFGLWNIISLLPMYASYAHLGARDSMRYLIPYHRGRGEPQKNIQIQGSVYYGSLFLNIIYAVPLVILSLTHYWDEKVRWGLFAMACTAILNWYCEYYLAILKAYQEFRIITASNFLRSTVLLACSIVFLYFFGIYGAYLTAIVSHAAVLAYFFLKYPLDPPVKFDRVIFMETIKDGFPIMIFGLLTLSMMTSGRIIVAYFMGNEQLGYYGIAMMVLTSLMYIPGTAREVIEPRLMEDLHESSLHENVDNYFRRPLINAAYFLPFFLGPVILVLPIAITVFLPNYMPAIQPTRILMLGLYFLALTYIFRGVLVAKKLQLLASAITAVMLCLNVALCVAFVTMNWGLNGVALGSSISFFILFLGLLSLIKNKYQLQGEGWHGTIRPLYLPFPVMCILLLFAEYGSQFMLFNNIVRLSVQVTVYSAGMACVVYFARKRYPQIKKIDFEHL